VTLDIPLERAGELPLSFEWGSSQLNEEVTIPIPSGITVNPDSGPLQVVLGVFLVLAGLAIGARMLWGTERSDD
jgi:hypothetical protein